MNIIWMSALEIYQLLCIGPSIMIGGEGKMESKESLVFKELASLRGE